MRQENQKKMEKGIDSGPPTVATPDDIEVERIESRITALCKCVDRLEAMLVALEEAKRQVIEQLKLLSDGK